MIKRIADADIARINDDAPIVAIIFEYTHLQAASGEDLLGTCPRCKELALEVATIRNVWFCHTCNIGGGPINFVQIATDCTFIKAAMRVCELAGIPDPELEPVPEWQTRLVGRRREGL